MNRSKLSKIILLVFAYIFVGWLGLQVPYLDTHITLLWLPTGIAVAALLLWGSGTWPAIYLAAFLVNLMTGASWSLALSIAIGNLLAPLVTFYGLRRFDFHPDFSRQKDVGIFVFASGAGMLISATLGLLSLLVAGELQPEQYRSAWLAWWMGDTVGVLLGAPILLNLTQRNLQIVINSWKEVVCWFAGAAVVAWLAFFYRYPQYQRLPLSFLPLPLLAWAALRFGNAGAAISGLIFSVAAILGASMGHGTFSMLNTEFSRLLLWCFMATTVVTGLLVAALQSERVQAERTLRASEEKLRGFYQLSPLAVVMTDLQGHYLEFNEAFLRLSGYTGEELKLLNSWQLTPKEYHASEAELLATLLHSEHYGPYEKEIIRKDGLRIPLQLRAMLVTGADGERYKWSIMEDISLRKATEAQLRDLAFYDPLTRLPNRRLLFDRLREALMASRLNQKCGAIIFIDLDNFKKLNDTKGHDYGDLLLVEVARRIRASVQVSDTVARLGGDEFVLILENLGDDIVTATGRANEVAFKVHHALNSVFNLNEHVHQGSASIGVAMFTGAEISVEDVIKQADLAMYQAKYGGRSRIQFYQPS